MSMVAVAARGIDAFDLITGLQDLGSGLLLILATVLLVPIGWGYLAAAPQRDARHMPTVPSQIGARLHWLRTIARQRAWTPTRRTTRYIAPMRHDTFRPGRPSPPIKRQRARSAIHQLTDGWQVVRYPH